MGRLLVVVVCHAVPVALGALAASGCAQIAGIHDTSGNGRPVDSVTVTRRSIGSTVDDAPLVLTGLKAAYFVERSNATGFDRVDADLGAEPGSWTTKLYDPAPVWFTLPDLPDPIPRLFAFPNHKLSVLYPLLEHPGYTPAPDGATFTVTAPLDAAYVGNESYQTYVVGAWLQRGFAAAELPAPGVGAAQIGPVAFSFAAANSLAGHAHPDQITAKDAFLILRYIGGQLTGFAVPTAPVEQTGMTTMVTTRTMEPVVADQSLDLKINPNTLATRYMAVRPNVASLAMSWNLLAAPGYRTASVAGPSLQSGTIGMAEVGVSVKYKNPFAALGWNTMFVLATSESRSYTKPGTALSIGLSAGMNQFIEPMSGFQLSLPAGLPILIAINGTPLTSDQDLPPPSQFVHVTFVTDSPAGTATPSATLYNLQVWDLVPNQAMTALDRHLVLAATGSEPSFDLPPDTFQAGHSYTLRPIATLGGYPGIADGDFVTRSLPLAQSFADSAVVTVMP